MRGAVTAEKYSKFSFLEIDFGRSVTRPQLPLLKAVVDKTFGGNFQVLWDNLRFTDVQARVTDGDHSQKKNEATLDTRPEQICRNYFYLTFPTPPA